MKPGVVLFYVVLSGANPQLGLFHILWYGLVTAFLCKFYSILVL